QAIYTYSLAGGLVADEDLEQRNGGPLNREMRGPGWARLTQMWRAANPQQGRTQGQPQEGQEVTGLPEGQDEIFKLLGHLLRQRHFAAMPGQQQTAQGNGQEERPVAVIIDYAEKLMPVGVAEGHAQTDQLAAVETAQRWAVDPLIRATNNIIILLTTNLGQLAANIHTEGSGCRAIRIPLPDDGERHAYIEHLIRLRELQGRVGLAALKDDDFGRTTKEQADTLATMTQGMRLADIDNLNRLIIMRSALNHQPPIISQGDVQHEKEQVIQAQSEQLLEVVPRRRTFDDIGGLDTLKKYLSSRAQLMKQRSRSPLVPSGLLLAGPPGTGKTIIAEALATVSGFNLVKMRNIQDRWVGSSERNLELVISLLKDLYPVVVFIDEVDQAVGRRDTGNNGDSGVSGRMFARVLEEMSDSSNRGRILWIAATNRADILDDALLRRYDRVVPLLAPDASEMELIFIRMPKAINSQSGHDTMRYGGDLELAGDNVPAASDRAKFHSLAEMTTRLGLTGAGIEVVVRRAAEFATEAGSVEPGPEKGEEVAVIQRRHLEAALDDYMPNHDPDVYDLQGLLAIQACNFFSVVPALPNRPPFNQILERDARGSTRISRERLRTEIQKLRAKTGHL
ncbi:MAG TPA: ATP-binding protein, partial [Ktedonobacterales bacterium]|nr:ATP-binding protein [Ktedonobacterales bacterium]